jgi:dimethylaniline monooxygenase (N-oxide forming)
LAQDLGVLPTFGRLVSRIFTSNVFRAISIFNAVYFGITSSAQYRLFGHDSKPGLASATLLRLAKGGMELSDEEEAALQADANLGLESLRAKKNLQDETS